MWIRHVYVPGIHNEEEDLLNLGRFIGTLNGVEKFEIFDPIRWGSTNGRRSVKYIHWMEFLHQVKKKWSGRIA